MEPKKALDFETDPARKEPDTRLRPKPSPAELYDQYERDHPLPKPPAATKPDLEKFVDEHSRSEFEDLGQ